MARWIADPAQICRPLTAAEAKAASALMEKDLLKAKRPMPPSTVWPDGHPQLVLAIGAPGSGKSTISAAIAKRVKLDVANFVEFDYDALIKYHPRKDQVAHVHTIDGKKTDVGYALGWTNCVDAVIQLGEPLLHDLIRRRYNIIVQTHNYDIIHPARRAGYYITVVYVGVRLQTALARSRARAAETGMFLSPTLGEQDETVAQIWRQYQTQAAFYGLWADRFIAVNNDAKGVGNVVYLPTIYPRTNAALAAMIEHVIIATAANASAAKTAKVVQGAVDAKNAAIDAEHAAAKKGATAAAEKKIPKG